MITFKEFIAESQKQFSSSEYNTVLSQLSRGVTSVQGITSAPLVKPMKNFNDKLVISTIKKAKIDIGNIEASDFDIKTDIKDLVPMIRTTLFIRELEKKIPDVENMSSSQIQDYLTDLNNKFTAALLTIFGTFVSGVSVGPQMKFLLTDEFLESAGLAERKIDVTSIIGDIFKKYNIKGLGFTSVSSIKSGYSVRYAGLDIVDQQTMKKIEADVSKRFADVFIMIKTDGEINTVAGRGVRDGLTNYRFFFTKELKAKYGLN